MLKTDINQELTEAEFRAMEEELLLEAGFPVKSYNYYVVFRDKLGAKRIRVSFNKSDYLMLREIKDGVITYRTFYSRL